MTSKITNKGTWYTLIFRHVDEEYLEWMSTWAEKMMSFWEWIVDDDAAQEDAPGEEGGSACFGPDGPGWRDRSPRPLPELSRDLAAVILSCHGRRPLRLRARTKISDGAVKILSRHPGDILWLDGLREIFGRGSAGALSASGATSEPHGIDPAFKNRKRRPPFM